MFDILQNSLVKEQTKGMVRKMKCPNCGSQETQFVTNTITKGPSFSKGCCGWIVFGPVGMLCSLCGTGSETDEYWICHSCGTKFQAGEYESELDAKIRKIGSLKSEIDALQESLHDKPIDLREELRSAENAFNKAKEKHSQFEESFLATSESLKRVYFVHNLIPCLALLMTAVVFLGALFSGEIIASLMCIIVGGGISWALMNVMEKIYTKAKRNTSEEESDKLDALWEERQTKEEHYKKLKKIKNNEDLLKQKKEELYNLENELEKYKANNK